MDDVILSTDVTARSHAQLPQRARPQGAEACVRDLLPAMGEAATAQERRAAALRPHKARQTARGECVERAAVKVASTPGWRVEKGERGAKNLAAKLQGIERPD